MYVFFKCCYNQLQNSNKTKTKQVNEEQTQFSEEISVCIGAGANTPYKWFA